MSYITRVVSTNTNELEFMREFVTALTNSAPNKIKFIGDIDTIFANAKADNKKVTLKFDIMNDVQLILTNTGNYSDYQFPRYEITIKIGDTTYDDPLPEMPIYDNPTSADSIINRRCVFTSIQSDNTFILYLGGYNKTTPQNFNAKLIVTKQNDNIYSTRILTTNDIPPFEDSKNHIIATQYNRLNYNRDTDIEIIETKVFGSNELITLTSTDIFDTSYVTTPNIIKIDDDRYFTLDNHTIIKI